MRKILVCLFLFALVFSHCGKEKISTREIDVSRYTQTDNIGMVVGTVDETDWTKDSVWTAAESQLFESPPATALAGTTTGSVSVFPAFPNPVSQTFGFAFKAKQEALIQLVVTDNRLVVKDRFSFRADTGSRVVMIRLTNDRYKSKTNYRLYYGFSSATDVLFFKGHGDLRLQ